MYLSFASFIVFVRIISLSNKHSIFNSFLYDLIYLYLFKQNSLMPLRYCIVSSSVYVFVIAYASMYVYDLVDVQSSTISMRQATYIF